MRRWQQTPFSQMSRDRHAVRRDLAEFAYRNELAGLCLHINDGGEASLSKMGGKGLEAYAQLLREWFRSGLGAKVLRCVDGLNSGFPQDACQ